MSRNIRQFALSLLVIVTVSIAALGVHAVSHDSGDRQTCEFCSGQGNPAHAIPPSNVQTAPPPQTYVIHEPLLVVDVPAVRTHAQQ
ncbi:MAG: hypothetical protein RIA65_02690, partial [Woeseia sp.]